MNTPATPWYFTVFMANAFKIRSAPCDWIQLAHKSKLCQHERLSHWRTYAAPRCASMAAVGADGRSPDAALLRREILGIKYTFVRGLADNNKKRLKMLKRHLNLNIYISTAWDASLDVIATFISRRPVHVCSLFSKFNLWLHIQHHASSRLLSALLRRCPELWCCQRCLSDRSRWWKKAKRACTSGTCSSVLRTLLDVELLNALIQSVRYCISILYTLHPHIIPYQYIVLHCFGPQARICCLVLASLHFVQHPETTTALLHKVLLPGCVVGC